jgi:glycosyltransferase involved in cell wall biosynthesis
MSHQQKKIRVLFIITLLDRMGGAEKNLCDIVLNLNREKFEPCVLAFKGGHCTETLAARGVPVQENGVGKLFSLSALRQVFALRRFLRQEKIDLVVTYHHDADIFGLLAAGTAGIPVISSRRDMGYQLEKKHILFYRWFGRFFSHFIAVSHAVKAVLIDREKIPAEKITVIHNGIALDAFPHPDPEKKARLTAELGLSPDKITIGMVASFRPVKGQEFLVEAIAHLPEWHEKIQVVIVGYKDTDYFKKVKLRIDALGLEKIFIFPGARDDIPEVLHLFDIFVISSRNEGFSNAIIEAMAAGLPVIAADSGGNREAVLNQKTGLLVSPCDSQALATALRQLLTDRDLSKIMGNEGKSRVAEEFSRERMIVANEVVYKQSYERSINKS